MTDIPRALSVEDQHPLARRIQVSVQQWVTSYDCDAGTVERLERSPLGLAVRDALRGDRFMTETVRGDVTVALLCP